MYLYQRNSTKLSYSAGKQIDTTSRHHQLFYRGVNSSSSQQMSLARTEFMMSDWNKERIIHSHSLLRMARGEDACFQ
jgi:hypothetical protein